MALVRMPIWAKQYVEFKDSDFWRFFVPEGGRGSAKSWTVARLLLLESKEKRLRNLCCRETMSSIRESVHELLATQIQKMDLGWFYKVGTYEIVGKNGSQFIFTGLRVDPEHMKSYEDVDRCWVEEAHAVTKQSWKVLIPTIRKPGSKILVTFNPRHPEDPTSEMFLEKPRPNAMVIKVNWQDNPYFTAENKADMEYDRKVDPDGAAHVWDGEYEQNSEATIFAGKFEVADFETPFYDTVTGKPWKTLTKDELVKAKLATKWNGPYYGSDFGFSQDPATLLRAWVNEEQTRIYIDQEFYQVKVPLSQLADKWDGIPGSRDYTIFGDASRPETIFHMREAGFDAVAAKKWPGSVEDGIEWLKQFEMIVVHTRCTNTAREFRLYKYKVDKLTGVVLRQIVDKWNHCIDALRYAFQKAICPDEEEVVVPGEYDKESISSALDQFDRSGHV